MLFDLSPLGRPIIFSLGADRLQQVRQTGETATRITVVRARRKHDVTEITKKEIIRCTPFLSLLE